MSINAQDILDHCKAVVEGRKPQPLPFWVERNADPDCYAINDGMPDPDGFGNPPNTMYIHFEDNDMTPSDWQLAARILGLDRPAPVVLEWKDDISSETPHQFAIYNHLISASIFPRGGYTLAQIDFQDRITIMTLPKVAVKDHESEARAWCEAEIQKIITPTPKP